MALNLIDIIHKYTLTKTPDKFKQLTETIRNYITNTSNHQHTPIRLSLTHHV